MKKKLLTIIFCIKFITVFSQKVYVDFLKKNNLIDASTTDNSYQLKNGYLIKKAKNHSYLYAVLIHNNNIVLFDSTEATNNKINFGRVIFDSKNCFYWAVFYRLFQPIYGKIVYKTDSIKSIDHTFFIDANKDKNELLFADAGKDDPKYFYLLRGNIIDTFIVNDKLLNLRYYKIKKIANQKLYLFYDDTKNDINTLFIMKQKN